MLPVCRRSPEPRRCPRGGRIEPAHWQTGQRADRARGAPLSRPRGAGHTSARAGRLQREQGRPWVKARPSMPEAATFIRRYLKKRGPAFARPDLSGWTGCLLLLRSGASERFLVSHAERPADISKHVFSFHLVDQGGDEGPRGSHQVCQVLLCDAAQISLPAVWTALSVCLGKRQQGVRQTRRYFIEGQAQHPLTKSPNSVRIGANDVQGERGPRFKLRSEVAALDRPYFGLSRCNGQLLDQGSIWAKQLPKEIAWSEHCHHRARAIPADSHQAHASSL